MTFLETINTLLRGKRPGSHAKAGKGGADLRRTRRIPQRMRSGYVWTEKLITPRPCMFRDLSTGGARVEVLGDPIKMSLLIDGVKLYFETEKHEIACSVAWVKGSMMGLKFDGRPRSPSRQYK
ncbi:MAG: PilZ domain-containing protein [Rhizobiales bacterium]|nr:PilZ domain-containing protein [Hyphomicrobiales bacterium]